MKAPKPVKFTLVQELKQYIRIGAILSFHISETKDGFVIYCKPNQQKEPPYYLSSYREQTRPRHYLHLKNLINLIEELNPKDIPVYFDFLRRSK